MDMGSRDTAIIAFRIENISFPNDPLKDSKISVLDLTKDDNYIMLYRYRNNMNGGIFKDYFGCSFLRLRKEIYANMPFLKIHGTSKRLLDENDAPQRQTTLPNW